MLHPHTQLQLVNDIVGYGVFATRFIPRGTITWVRDRFDQTFTPPQIVELGPVHRDLLGKYGFVDAAGDTILCWDHGRFVNHSCAPTCLSPGHAFEVAVRDIQAGEEVTDDYATLNLEYSFECACGTPACRGVVTPEDSLRLAEQWDREIAAAYPCIREVEQPLWDLLPDPLALEAELAGAPIASCRANLLLLRGERDARAG